MWDLQLSDEQAMIAESIKDYLANELPLERLRPKMPVKDRAAVRAGMVEMGLFGVGLPESVGGSGMGFVEEVLIQRMCGRFLVSPGVLATTLAAHVATEAGDNALAAALVGGEASTALTIVSPEGDDAGGLPVFAIDWSEGDLLLHWSDDGMGLYGAEAFTGAQEHESFDNSVTTHLGKLAVGKPRHWISSDKAPLAMRAQVLLAARLIGLSEQALEITTEYAKTREQFGKPIGSFQAVKHRCADMALRSHLGWLQTSLACLKVENGASDMKLQAAAALLNASHAGHENGRAAIQMHGGMGFHAECDAHWFMKRAHLYDQAGGPMSVIARTVVSEPSPLL